MDPFDVGRHMTTDYCPRGEMEKARAVLASEAENMNEIIKSIYAMGLNLGSGMEEALNRMERGEDPEKIEEEMEDLLEQEDPFTFGSEGKEGRSEA